MQVRFGSHAARHRFANDGFTKTSKRQGAKVQWTTIDQAFIRQIYPGEDCKAIKLPG